MSMTGSITNHGGGVPGLTKSGSFQKIPTTGVFWSDLFHISVLNLDIVNRAKRVSESINIYIICMVFIRDRE